MWQFITGFSLGVYVGSFYDCRPAIKAVQIFLRENMPEEKHIEKPVEKKAIKPTPQFSWPFS